jgi:hypothetical protein
MSKFLLEGLRCHRTRTGVGRARKMCRPWTLNKSVITCTNRECIWCRWLRNLGWPYPGTVVRIAARPHACSALRTGWSPMPGSRAGLSSHPICRPVRTIAKPRVAGLTRGCPDAANRNPRHNHQWRIPVDRGLQPGMACAKLQKNVRETTPRPRHSNGRCCPGRDSH